MSDTELKHTVSVNTQCLRTVCGYTREDISDKCDIRPRTVHNIEHEKSMQRLNTVVKLSRCLGVSVNKLIYLAINEEDNDDRFCREYKGIFVCK